MLPIQTKTAPKPWDHTPDGPPVTIEVRTGDQPPAITTDEGRVRVRPGAVADPDAVILGDPPLIVGLLSGQFGLAAAVTAGLEFEGDPGALRRAQPGPASPASAKAEA